MPTIKELSEMIMEMKTSILTRLDNIDNKFNALNKQIADTTVTADKSLKLAESTNEICAVNIEKIDMLKQESSDCNIRITKLEEELDNQINRNMRSTLVFKNVPGSETKWNETTKILCEIISEYDSSITTEEAESWVERAHRIKPYQNPKYDDKRDHIPENIVAKFSSWKHSETVREIIIKKNQVADPSVPRIFVEQLQSKKLTARTNNAKKCRKDIKLEHPDWLMYVSHPAKLMLKKPGEKSYKLLEQF